MITRTVPIAVFIVALALSATPASAITHGTVDGDAHPFVGLMVAQDANRNPLWRCSGTLLSPTVFLTAGHCTHAPAVHAEIWFASDVHAGIPANGYPFVGEVGGRTYTHPAYDRSRFFERDLGVVVLGQPVPMATYGRLPRRNQLDAERPGRSTAFTAVGYGVQKAFPDRASWKDQSVEIRMQASPWLVQINTGFTGDFSVLLSNNGSSGGTCFGDSGGPNFIGTSNVVGGVTSYGLNGECAGTGGVYRLDRAWNLNWLAGFGLSAAQ